MRRVRLTSLILEFTWTGLASFGGGRSAYLYDRVVGRRGWVTSEEFVQDLARPDVLALRPEERLRHAQEARGAALLEDDFSLVEVRFH